MKKYILASVITAFVATFTAQAQENTYNMVIKMANGTTITIGPNEIENIVFNDGAVTVSGKRIDDFVSSLDLLEKKTETLTSKADLVAAITDLEAKINEVGTAKNSEIRAEIDAIEAQLQYLKDNSGSSYDDTTIKAEIEKINTIIDEIKKSTEAGYDDTAVKENVAKLQAAQDEIKKAIAALEEKTISLEKNTGALEDYANTLVKKADLVAAITDLEAKINEVGTAKNSEIRAEIDALKQEIANLNTSDIIAMINVLQMQIKSLTDEVAALKNDGSNNDNQGGGKDDDSSSSATNSQLVGVWHQYINGYIIGFCFYADGTGWKGEWQSGRSEEHRPLTWIVEGNRLRTYSAKDGDQLDDYTFSISGDDNTLTLVDTETGYPEEFKRQ